MIPDSADVMLISRDTVTRVHSTYAYTFDERLSVSRHARLGHQEIVVLPVGSERLVMISAGTA